MEKDTLQYLETKSNLAVLPGARAGHKFVREGFTPIIVESQALDLQAFDIDSLVSALAQPCEANPGIEWSRRVLVGDTCVLGVAQGKLTDENFRVRLDLPIHPAFKVLTQLVNSQVFDQKSFIRLLRATFAGFVDADLIASFRRLSTQGSSDAHFVQDPAMASLGGSVRTQLEAGGAKPVEEFTVMCPVYAVPELLGFTVPVRVLVESFLDDQKQPKMEITTVYNTLELGRNAATRDVETRVLASLLEMDGMGNTPILRASL